MRSEIGNHFVEVLKPSCGQVDGVALFGTIIIRAPFFEVAPIAGVSDVYS